MSLEAIVHVIPNFRVSREDAKKGAIHICVILNRIERQLSRRRVLTLRFHPTTTLAQG